MNQQDIDFNAACDAFTAACNRAAHWKHNYPGARYSNRLVPAIIELQAAIEKIKHNPELAAKFNERAVVQLAAFRNSITRDQK